MKDALAFLDGSPAPGTALPTRCASWTPAAHVLLQALDKCIPQYVTWRDMPRMTIFVPDEVFARMQSARTKTGPNWSQVATEAFERTLQQLHEARSKVTTAVHLPYPTTGDYDVWEVKHRNGPFQVKVTRSAAACKWPKPLPRIVSAFAREIIEDNPGLAPGSILPKMLTTTAVEDVLRRM